MSRGLKKAIESVQEELNTKSGVGAALDRIDEAGLSGDYARQSQIAKENSLMQLNDSHRRLIQAETDQIKHKKKAASEWAHFGTNTGLCVLYLLLAYDIAIRLIGVLW